MIYYLFFTESQLCCHAWKKLDSAMAMEAEALGGSWNKVYSQVCSMHIFIYTYIVCTTILEYFE